mgnify:CR=1 FL=1
MPVAATTAVVYALRPTDGSVKWTAQLPSPKNGGAYAAPCPGDDGVLYVAFVTGLVALITTMVRAAGKLTVMPAFKAADFLQIIAAASAAQA